MTSATSNLGTSRGQQRASKTFIFCASWGSWLSHLLTNLIGAQPKHGYMNFRSHVKGSNTHIPAQSTLQTGSRRTPRPLFPPFLQEQSTRAQEQQGQVGEFTTYFKEYQALWEEIQVAMSYHDFCNLKLRNIPRTTKSEKNFFFWASWGSWLSHLLTDLTGAQPEHGYISWTLTSSLTR